jgi:lysozyme family protein
MPRVRLTQVLREEYDRLFDTCEIRSAKVEIVERRVRKIVAARERYIAVIRALGGSIPWHFVAVIHAMESGLDFSRHLHNGDPLTGRTVHVPAGKPVRGAPPFTWEESAEDALVLKRLDSWSDWGLAGTLYKLEDYNGWGYRLYHPHVLSPYLWSYSHHYVSGKYVADGRWSDTAVSRQCGAAVLLRRMAEFGFISLEQPGIPIERIRYAPRTYSEKVEELQRFFNTLPGVFLKVDGIPGPLTSEAFRKATGRYLIGDRRA